MEPPSISIPGYQLARVGQICVIHVYSGFGVHPVLESPYACCIMHIDLWHWSTLQRALNLGEVKLGNTHEYGWPIPHMHHVNCNFLPKS
eukprot:1152745-Pelagomonas_calceolata.AAC.3